MSNESLPERIRWAFAAKGRKFYVKANALREEITAKAMFGESLEIPDILDELLTMAYDAGYEQGLKQADAIQEVLK